MHKDPRLAAFLSPEREVFHSVEHRHEVWKDDPFDVKTLHSEARAIFERLLSRATAQPGVPSGRILLLLGESGCGKTHLVRAFRNQVHADGLGFVGYMQMTSATSNYGRYTLSNLIDSLDQPYFELNGPTSGLMRLSTALASRVVEPGRRSALREAPEAGPDSLHDLVNEAADQLIAQPIYRDRGVDLDLVRALLYLQRDDARIKSRVLKYLRCEDLSPADRDVLGGIIPRTDDDAPQRLVELLGKLTFAVGSASLVICVDQLEDMIHFEDAEVPFRRAMSTICALADRVPSSIFVICCLEDYYKEMRGRLSRSMIDRIELDPDPIVLQSTRTAEEIELLIARRLQHLYEVSGAPFDESEPTYPFSPEGIRALDNLRTRDVLDACRRYHERAMTLGRLPDAFPLPEEPARGAPPGKPSEPSPPVAAPPPTIGLEQVWNDFLAAYTKPRPDADEDFLSLFAWATRACSDEVDTGHRFEARLVDGGMEVDATAPDSAVSRLLIGLCNKSAKGGGLSRQIAAVVERAGKRTAVLLRCTDFPSTPGTNIAKEIGSLIAKGGRRTVVEDADWRAMMALRDFTQTRATDPRWAAWLVSEKPLSKLRSLREALDLDNLKPAQKSGPRPAAPAAPAAPAPSAPPDTLNSRQLALALPAAAGSVIAGTEGGLVPRPVTLRHDELTRHAAFLGGSGSGKTTLALNLLEQLLLQGVPAILIDRKGDLSGYARDDIWSRPLPDPRLAARRDRLRDAVDVALFTPGHPAGRPLSISLVPEGLSELSDFEREQEASYAAQAIGGMLDYRHQGRDKTCRAILAQALCLLSRIAPQASITLEALIHLIDSADPELVSAVGRLDTKLFEKLVNDLETLRLTSDTLFSSAGERLDIDALLGLGAFAAKGRTRLSVITTKFLGDNGRILFWVSQLLLEVLRWSSRRPSNSLQAVLLFDEADLYLPAQAQPATKAPMESLLKRARSAGLGIMLATQSPGDLDYKCRDTIGTWFVGRVKEPTALSKMKPMLSESRVDVTAKLAGQATGQFHLLRSGDVVSFRSDLSAMPTEQLAEERLLALAARGAPGQGGAKAAGGTG